MNHIQIFCLVVVLLIQLAIMFNFIQPSPITFYLSSILLTFALGMEGCRDKITGGLGMPEFFKSNTRKDEELYISIINRIQAITYTSDLNNLTKEYVLQNKEKFIELTNSLEKTDKNIFEHVYNMPNGSSKKAWRTQECFRLILKELDWSNLDNIRQGINNFVHIFNIYCGVKEYPFKNSYINKYFWKIVPHIDFCTLVKNSDKIDMMFESGLSKLVDPIKNKLPVLNSLDNDTFMQNFELYLELSKLPSNLFEDPSLVPNLTDLDNIKKIINQSNYLKEDKELYNKYPNNLLIESFYIQNSLGTSIAPRQFLNNPDLYYKLRDLKKEYDKYNRRRPYEPKSSDIDTPEKVQYQINSLTNSIDSEKSIENHRWENSRFK